LLFGLGTEDGSDLFGNFDLLLAGAARQLVGSELGQNLLERELDQGMVTIGGLGEDARRGGFSDVAETDLDAALGQLREDLMDRNRDAETACGGLADFALERIGQLEDDGAKGNGYRTRGGRRVFLDEFGAAGLGGGRGGKRLRLARVAIGSGLWGVEIGRSNVATSEEPL
jgi:hypothetical protein